MLKGEKKRRIVSVVQRVKKIKSNIVDVLLSLIKLWLRFIGREIKNERKKEGKKER